MAKDSTEIQIDDTYLYKERRCFTWKIILRSLTILGGQLTGN